MSPPYSYNHILLSLPLLLILISHFVTISNTQKSDFDICNADDKKVLLRIKKYLGNPPSLTSWNLSNGCGDPVEGGWKGVSCNLQARVDTLVFYEIHDVYRIPPYLDQLPGLTRLEFVFMAHLAGPVPHYIGQLTNLWSFTISMTNVSGPIPSFLGGLTNLGTLDLSSNKFTGPIPNFLGRLTRLSLLNLSNNTLTGPISPILAKLPSLGYLALHTNNLSGPIPDFIAHRLHYLTDLILHTNQFSGPVPTSLVQLHNLMFLSLSKNQLSGPVPKSLGGRKLVVLSLGSNKLTGDATFLIDKSNNDLFDVDISNNLFKFDLTNVELAPRLSSLNISHNMIYGRLPALNYLLRESMIENYVDVSYNELCGPIPNGRRLKQVNPNVFAHNKCLCGGPLPACK